jgi:hypothetical protein
MSGELKPIPADAPPPVNTRRVRRNMADTADRFLSRLLLADHREDEVTLKTYKSAYRHLWGCDFHLLDDLIEEMNPGTLYLMDKPREYANVFWPVDHATAVFKEEFKGVDDVLMLTRITTADPAEIRGKATIVPPKTVFLAAGWEHDGEIKTDLNIFGLTGGAWRSIANPVLSQRQDGMRGDISSVMLDPPDAKWREDAQCTIGILFASMLTERYNWHVAFGFNDDGPRMVLPTSPRGALSLFRDRELEPGKYRRDALKHWVTEHYRDKISDPETVTYVRNHLRGHTKFIWNSLFVEVMPSASDLEANEFFKAQAAEWRSRRGHNRIRIRGVK